MKFSFEMGFLKKSLKKLGPTNKMDLDFWDFSGRDLIPQLIAKTHDIQTPAPL